MQDLEKLCRLIRYYILISTTAAGSGHPTSSLSAVELMTTLMFKYFHYDLQNPHNPTNDHLIFSKGHASPLFYALWAAAGAIEEKELLTLRKFGSRLEGHPTLSFPYTELPTGSLGQGLSAGVGIALALKSNGVGMDAGIDNHQTRNDTSFKAANDKRHPNVFVLLGDSEFAEGQNYEALQIAAHYKLNNLVGILDVNRLGQRGETMYGHDIDQYKKRIDGFGWNIVMVEDGHDLEKVNSALREVETLHEASLPQPTMIIARTIKGKGVSFLEDKNGWHGKALNDTQLTDALKELGEVDKTIHGSLTKPIVEVSQELVNPIQPTSTNSTNYRLNEKIATRKAYGEALRELGENNKNIVVLDAETNNSTYSEFFKEKFPNRFYEMFIAEQNMVSVAVGLARMGKMPYISTFAAFFTRAFDQIRMAAYAQANIKFCGSHAGVSIGVDGSSQMGLEDIGMFRSIYNSVVLYPSDAISAAQLTKEAGEHQGIVYIRTTREATPVIYSSDETFPIGGCKVHRFSSPPYQGGADQPEVDSGEVLTITIISAGITLHEALKAQKELRQKKINVTVIDLYSIKPLDTETLYEVSKNSKAIIVVEDHYPEGGIAEAVLSALQTHQATNGAWPIHSLAVRKMPHSGKPEELLDYEEIAAESIISKVKSLS